MHEVHTQEKGGWWGRLRQAVSRTREQFVERVDDALRGREEIAPAIFAELEAILLGADLGVETTTELLQRLRERVERKDLTEAAALRGALREELTALRGATHPRPP